MPKLPVFGNILHERSKICPHNKLVTTVRTTRRESSPIRLSETSRLQKLGERDLSKCTGEDFHNCLWSFPKKKVNLKYSRNNKKTNRHNKVSDNNINQNEFEGSRGQHNSEIPSTENSKSHSRTASKTWNLRSNVIDKMRDSFRRYRYQWAMHRPTYRKSLIWLMKPRCSVHFSGTNLNERLAAKARPSSKKISFAENGAKQSRTMENLKRMLMLRKEKHSTSSTQSICAPKNKKSSFNSKMSDVSSHVSKGIISKPSYEIKSKAPKRKYVTVKRQLMDDVTEREMIQMLPPHMCRIYKMQQSSGGNSNACQKSKATIESYVKDKSPNFSNSRGNDKPTAQHQPQGRNQFKRSEALSSILPQASQVTHDSMTHICVVRKINIDELVDELVAPVKSSTQDQKSQAVASCESSTQSFIGEFEDNSLKKCFSTVKIESLTESEELLRKYKREMEQQTPRNETPRTADASKKTIHTGEEIKSVCATSTGAKKESNAMQTVVAVNPTNKMVSTMYHPTHTAPPPQPKSVTVSVQTEAVYLRNTLTADDESDDKERESRDDPVDARSGARYRRTVRNTRKHYRKRRRVMIQKRASNAGGSQHFVQPLESLSSMQCHTSDLITENTIDATSQMNMNNSPTRKWQRRSQRKLKHQRQRNSKSNTTVYVKKYRDGRQLEQQPNAKRQKRIAGGHETGGSDSDTMTNSKAKNSTIDSAIESAIDSAKSAATIRTINKKSSKKSTGKVNTMATDKVRINDKGKIISNNSNNNNNNNKSNSNKIAALRPTDDADYTISFHTPIMLHKLQQHRLYKDHSFCQLSRKKQCSKEALQSAGSSKFCKRTTRVQ